jgi:hypothetical protein
LNPGGGISIACVPAIVVSIVRVTSEQVAVGQEAEQQPLDHLLLANDRLGHPNFKPSTASRADVVSPGMHHL